MDPNTRGGPEGTQDPQTNPFEFGTVQQALRWTLDQLTRVGAGSRWLAEDERRHALQSEAETLLLWATGWSRTRFISSLLEELPPGAQTRLRQAVAARQSGLPLQYVTGEAAFFGRLFSVRPGCLIPRPETEVLADLAIAWIVKHGPASTVVDLGTGSGILAVTLRLECPQTRIYALDVSQEALEIAKENAHRLGAAAGMEFVHGDGLRWLRESAVPLQVLVSNPPYIPSYEVAELDDEVRLHEPHLALDGGEDGLAVYRVLSEIGDRRFAPGPAALFLEVGAGQAAEVLAMFDHPRWRNWQFDQEADMRGIFRVVWGFRRNLTGPP